MIAVHPLTDISLAERAALEAFLSVECDSARYAPAVDWDTHTLRDLDAVGLMAWSLRNGSHLTPAGRALVVDLAHVDAVHEDLRRRVLDAPTEEFAAVTVGRHRLIEPEFLDTFVEAAAEHTAELEAIAAEPAPLARRFVRWFTRNLTGARVTVMATTAGVLAGTGLGWWLA